MPTELARIILGQRCWRRALKSVSSASQHQWTKLWRDVEVMAYSEKKQCGKLLKLKIAMENGS